MENAHCPKCHLPVLAVFYFCPNCGKNLRPKPLSTSIGKQISIYLLSVFIPPFGLVPGFKYLFQKSTKAKLVGFVAILFTILSISATVYYTRILIDELKNQMNILLNQELNNQLNNQLDSQLKNQLNGQLEGQLNQEQSQMLDLLLKGR